MDDDGCTPPKTDLHKKRPSHNGFILAGKTPLVLCRALEGAGLNVRFPCVASV